MGSTINIEHDPKRWAVGTRGTFLKKDGEKLLSVTIGDFDDGFSGSSPIELYIRESIYQKLMSGEYTVQPGYITRLIVLDSNGNLVKPYLGNGEFIY